MLVYIALLLIVLPLSSSLLALLLFRRRVRTIKECVHCKKYIHVFDAFRCPQCGADLRETGMRPAGFKVRWITVIAVGVWMALLPFVLFGSATDIAHSVPSIIEVNNTASLGHPRSGAYSKVELSGAVRLHKSWFGRSTETIDKHWSADVRDNGVSKAYLFVDAIAGRVTFQANGTEREEQVEALDGSMLAVWMRSAFEDAPHPEWLDREAAAIIKSASAWMERESPTSGQSPSDDRSGQRPFRTHGSAGGRGEYPTIPPVVVLAAFVGVWLGIGGLMVLAALHRIGRQISGSLSATKE